MKRQDHLLIVDDELNVRKVLSAMLEQAGYSTATASSGDEALARVREHDPDLILTDLKMTGMDGLELLRALQAGFPEIPVIMLTAHGTVETAVEAMKCGAHDFLSKPFDKSVVTELIGKSLGQARRARAGFQGPLAPDHDCGIVGVSESIGSLRTLINKVAASSTTVLITGETGTGKELVAEAIHRTSERSRKPLIKINCGALPESLVEAELFGHERGAFTGADAARPGRFELADGGTLFLDEIGDTPAAIQVKLLRVLQDGQVDRVGGRKPVGVDVRLVTATNIDLREAVQQGRFREDLYYRLKVVELRVPSLGERVEDIPPLVEFFLEKHSKRLSRPTVGISGDAMDALTARAWPGNVRELENAVERAVVLGDTKMIERGDLGLEAGAPSARAPAGSSIKQAARIAAEDTERRMIREALDATGGNVTRAADRLGLSRRGLQIKMKELGIGRISGATE